MVEKKHKETTLLVLDAFDALLDTPQTSSALTQTLQQAEKDCFEQYQKFPLLQNTLRFVSSQESKEDVHVFRNHIRTRMQQAREYLENTEQTLVGLGARKIKNHMTVFTTGESSLLRMIFNTARKQGKKFTVKNINITDIPHKIKKEVLEKADLFLVDAESITSEHITHKEDRTWFVDLAEHFQIPCYVCAPSWSYMNTLNTFAGEKEVIGKRFLRRMFSFVPQDVSFPEQETRQHVIHPEHITGVISELGIHDHAAFLKQVHTNHPWMG